MNPEIRSITSAQTLPLRQAELRQHRPLQDSAFPGDDDPGTLHLGAFVGERIVGVTSLYPRPLPEAAQGIEAAASTCWQLRGMAVASEHQGTGVGKTLLVAGIERIRERGGLLLWCNARVRALGFYRKAGFGVCSEEFNIPEAGAHFVMARRVEEA